LTTGPVKFVRGEDGRRGRVRISRSSSAHAVAAQAAVASADAVALPRTRSGTRRGDEVVHPPTPPTPLLDEPSEGRSRRAVLRGDALSTVLAMGGIMVPVGLSSALDNLRITQGEANTTLDLFHRYNRVAREVAAQTRQEGISSE